MTDTVNMSDSTAPSAGAEKPTEKDIEFLFLAMQHLTEKLPLNNAEFLKPSGYSRADKIAARFKSMGIKYNWPVYNGGVPPPPPSAKKTPAKKSPTKKPVKEKAGKAGAKNDQNGEGGIKGADGEVLVPLSTPGKKRGNAGKSKVQEKKESAAEESADDFQVESPCKRAKIENGPAAEFEDESEV